METYESLKDFVNALPPPEEGLTELTRHVMQTGLVDHAQTDEQKMRFAPGTQCSNWTEVPASIIESVEWIDNRRCGGDTYPYVRLHLKSPGTDEGDAIFQALTGILQQPGTAPGPMTPPGPTRTVPPRPGPMTPPGPTGTVPPRPGPMTPPGPTGTVPPQPVPTTPPASGYVAPAGQYAASTRGHATSARRYAPAPPRPGPNTPGPVSGCGDELRA